MKPKTFHEFQGLIMNNKPGKKACLLGEGVAVDKIRKCGRYIAYTALVALHGLIYQLF